MNVSWHSIGLVLVLLSFLTPCCHARLFENIPENEQGDHNRLPNFILILTDDLDLTLGGMQASTLAKTRRYIGAKGMSMNNWFAQTPVCCPSRAELLTGRMFHNLRTGKVDDQGCMHVNVEANSTSPFYSKYFFAKYFSDLFNYTVGVFGKNLNSKNIKTCPPGVDRWLVNGGGDYLNPSFAWHSKGVPNPSIVKFDNCSETTGYPCYSTSIIGNASIDWIRDHVTRERHQPFFAYVSVKAPHIQDGPYFPQTIPAPWYHNVTIPEKMAPRTSNYNLSCPDHHWLVRNQPPLTLLQGQQVDKLYQTRLKSLLSVDDLVESIVQTLEEVNMIDNTYIVFTSDNGYRLGQFRMPVCKLHPYENDIRVPMMIRGPRIPHKSQSSLLGSHVDLMPTLLGLAFAHKSNISVDHQDESIIPVTMDGSNLAPYMVFKERNNVTSIARQMRHEQPSSLLIEYMSLGNVTRYEHSIDTYNHTFLALRIMDDSVSPMFSSNLKYIEFYDSRIDWQFQNSPLELELYDLNKDPYEIHNSISEISSVYQSALHDKVKRMFRCKGKACRDESRAGVFRD